ncbi:phage tail protein [Paenibacillus chitinolyticus]|uniref:phage tail-collar fiber domain-containing protein n=1 Tax=Paenibacillus chitinolyticus TaxID=79263 RepID=UPI0035569C5B
MGAFGGFVLTNKGRNLQAKAQTGVTLNYTRMGVGDGQLGGQSIPVLTKLIGEKKSLAISKLKIQTQGRAVIGAVLSNQDVTTGFYFREIGIYAQDPDEGEILYCYGNAGTNAEYIPPVGGADIIEKSIDAIVIVGNAANVTAEIDKSLVFASQNDLAESEKRLRDYAESHLENAPSKAFTLENGLQVVNSERMSRFKLESLKGRTLVNRVGRTGSEANVSIFAKANILISKDAATYTTGTSSYKITATGTGSNEHYCESPRYFIEPNKSYVMIGDARVGAGNVVAGYRLIIRDAAGNVVSDATTTTASKTGVWSVVGMRFVTPATAATFEWRGQIFKADGSFPFIPNASTPEHANFDSLRLFEIGPADYEFLTTSGWDKASLRFPYVDDMKHTTGAYIIKIGENLAPTSNEWERGNAAENEVVFKNSYTADIVYNPNRNVYARFYAPVLAGQSYTVSAKTAPSNAAAYYYYTDYDKNRLSDVLRGSNVAPPKSAFIEVVLKAIDVNLNPIAGTVTYSDVMVNLGTKSRPFKAREDDYLFFSDVKLASNVDGSVTDEVTERDGKYWKTSRFREVEVNGSLPWLFNIARAGLKRVFASSAVAEYVSRWQLGSSVLKYDGKIMVPGAHMDGMDRYTFEDSDLLYITIANTDSGWGDNYTPSVDEIKAYFNGWRMYYWNSTTQQTELFNNQGTKSWEPIVNTEAGAETVVLPKTKWKNHTPYRLTYQLSRSFETEIVPEGAITLHEGFNQFEAGTGMIVRERVVAAYDIGSGKYNINAAGYAAMLKNKVKSFFKLYRNRKAISDYYIVKAGIPATGLEANGDWLTNVDDRNPDKPPFYEVTYLTLNPLSAPLSSIGASLSMNLKTIVDMQAQANADIETRVSTLERDAMSIKGGNVETLRINGNAATVALVGKDHTYLEFYPQGNDAGRKGYVGYPSAGFSSMHIQNANPLGNIDILPGTGGLLRVDGNPVWHEGRLRMNNGALEYLDGSTWKAVSGGMEQYKPIIKRQTIVLNGNQTLNAIHFTGKCYLSRIAALSGGLGRLRVFVDGSLYYDSTLVVNYVNGIFQNNDVSYNSDSSLAVYQPTLRPSSGNIGYNSSNSSYGRVSDFPNSSALQGSAAIISQPIFAKSSIVIELTNTSTSNINMEVDFAGGVFQ